GVGDNLIESLEIKVQPLRQCDGLCENQLVHAEDHVVADLGRLTGAHATAVCGGPAHDIQGGSSIGDILRCPAHHEGECAIGGTDHTSGDRCIDVAGADCSDLLINGAGLIDGDRGGIDDEDIGVYTENLGDHRVHQMAIGQHGDGDVHTGDGLGGGVNGSDTVIPCLLECLRAEIASGDLVTSPGQVGCHGVAHLSQTDEGDFPAHDRAPFC